MLRRGLMFKPRENLVLFKVNVSLTAGETRETSYDVSESEEGSRQTGLTERR